MPFKKGHKPGVKKGAKTAPKRKPAKKFLFTAPKDMKPFFLHIIATTGKDGLLNSVEAIRFKGRPDNPKAKKSVLSEDDPKTLAAIAVRLGGTAFVTNLAKRLPAKAAFRLECRVGANAEGNLRFSVRSAVQKLDEKKKTLKKTDPTWKRLRRCAKVMPAAFVKVLPFPTATKKKKDEEDEE
jgi:hypothetical protein